MTFASFATPGRPNEKETANLSADTFVHDSTGVKKNLTSSVGSVAQLLSLEVGENGHSAQPLPSVLITFHHWLVSNVAASTAVSPPSCGRNQ